MTHEEAAKKLEEQRIAFNESYIDYGGVNDAYNMAIEALKRDAISTGETVTSGYIEPVGEDNIERDERFYKKGCNDAWSLARVIVKMNNTDYIRCFSGKSAITELDYNNALYQYREWKGCEVTPTGYEATVEYPCEEAVSKESVMLRVREFIGNPTYTEKMLVDDLNNLPTVQPKLPPITITMNEPCMRE